MAATREIIKRNMADRKKAHEEMKGIIKKAEDEKRELRADETNALEALNTKIDELDSRIQQLESVAQREDDEKEDEEKTDDDERADDDTVTDEEEGEEPDGRGRVIILPDGRRAQLIGSGREVARQRRQTVKVGIRQRIGESDSQYRIRKRRASEQYRAAVYDYMLGRRSITQLREMRALQADLDIQGGYLVMPEQFVNKVLKAADNYLYLRQLATVFRVDGAQSIGVPSLDTDPSDADWTSELATGSEDSAMAFGKRELKPSPLAKRIKISNKAQNLASVSGVNSVNDESEGGQGSGFENFVTGRLGYKFAVTVEKALMTGNGVGQPLGIFTASTRGISTGRDVQTGSATGITFDGLIDAQYNLKAPYQTRAQWLFSRTGVKKIRQLKDSQNRYLWEPSTQAGEPNKLLDRPVIMSEYCPSTFTTGQYIGMYADFSFLWLVESATLQMIKLEELYAETNQIGYIARLEIDAMPALEEAFTRLITN